MDFGVGRMGVGVCSAGSEGRGCDAKGLRFSQELSCEVSVECASVGSDADNGGVGGREAEIEGEEVGARALSCISAAAIRLRERMKATPKIGTRMT